MNRNIFTFFYLMALILAFTQASEEFLNLRAVAHHGGAGNAAGSELSQCSKLSCEFCCVGGQCQTEEFCAEH